MIDQRARLIDEYIKKNPGCKRDKRTVAITRQDHQQIFLECYDLPRHLLRYNIENGRFRSEYLQKIKDLGKDALDNEWTKMVKDKETGKDKEIDNEDIS